MADRTFGIELVKPPSSKERMVASSDAAKLRNPALNDEPGAVAQQKGTAAARSGR